MPGVGLLLACLYWDSSQRIVRFRRGLVVFSWFSGWVPSNPLKGKLLAGDLTRCTHGLGESQMLVNWASKGCPWAQPPSPGVGPLLFV